MQKIKNIKSSKTAANWRRFEPRTLGSESKCYNHAFILAAAKRLSFINGFKNVRNKNKLFGKSLKRPYILLSKTSYFYNLVRRGFIKS